MPVPSVTALPLISALLLGASPVGEPQNDLAACWHFDEPDGDALFDAGPEGSDLQLRGARRVEGRFGQGIRTGGGAYAEGEGIRELREGTLEAWARLRSPPPGQVGIVTFGQQFGLRNDAAILGWMPSPDSGETRRLGFGICANEWVVVRWDDEPPLGEWLHLAGSWGPAGLQVYANGTLVAEKPDYRSPLPDHAAVLLGASSWGATLDADIDEVRVYRVALSADEIGAHAESSEYASEPPQPTAEDIKRRPRRPAVVDVADFASEASFTAGIQEAIDALPRSGGEVRVPPGRYVLQRPVELRNNVMLCGSGASTLLTRPEAVLQRLTAPAEAGATSVQVESTDGLALGAEYGVFDDQMHGWYITHARIVRIEDHTVELDRPLVKPVSPDQKAGLVNCHPLIYARNRRDVTVQDLCLDGAALSHQGGVADFTFAAIHFHNVSDSRVTGCWVRNYPSDGIGIQGGRGVSVTDCKVENCRGPGLHPGTSIKDSVFSNNISRGNTGDGLFFCANVRHIVVSNSVFAENGGSGIGGLGNSEDKYNVVSGNTCTKNGHYGILAIDGSDNTITGNVCVNNGQSKPGAYSGIGLIRTTDTLVTGNRCTDDRETPTQKAGIEEGEGSNRNLIANNLCRGNAERGIIAAGPETVRQANLE